MIKEGYDRHSLEESPMKKRVLLFLLGLFLLSAPAWAGDPDLEGRVTKIEMTKSILTVKNELENKIGKREYRILVKQGMINDYKKNDKLKVWLMADRKEAKKIERIDR